ncbi:PAS domain S-box protein [Desulfobotulus mexicanus]|nr:PAS domain S-box protein [Desulfobotulus mexicanus]
MTMKIERNRLKPQKIFPNPIPAPWLSMAGALVLLFFTISIPVQAEERNLSDNQRLKALSMASFEAIFLSEKGICIEQNQSAETLFGYTLDDARGRPGTDWIAPIDRPMVMEKMMSGYGGAYEVRALRKDGTEFHAEIQGRIIEVGDRRIRVTALRDISDRKELQAKMAASTRFFMLWLFGVIFLLLALSTGLFFSILQRKRSDSELKKRTWELESIFKSARTVSLIKTDMDSIVEEFSSGAEEIFGYTREEMIGRHVGILHTEAESFILKKYVDRLVQGEGFTIETELVRKNGSLFPALFSVQPVYDTNGSIISTLGITFDISELKAAESSLRRSELKYRLLFENMNAAFALHEMIYDQDGRPVDYRFLEINPMFEKLTGAKREMITGRTVKEAIPETEDYWIETFGQVCLTGQPISYENYSKGIGRHFDTFAFSPEKDHFAVFFVDITDKKKAEENLKTSEERFNRAISGTGAGLWDWDMIKNTVYFSPQWKKMLGYEDHEIPNDFSGWRQLWHPDDALYIEKSIQEYLDGKSESYEVEHRLLNKEGNWQWILTRGEIEKDASGRPIRWTGTNIDITHRKQAEDALKLAKEEAEAANAAKGEFLANMSHEIRTPLNAVIGLSRLMADTPLNIQQHNWLEKINRSSRLLLGIINDILDYSKIDAGKLVLDYQPFTLKDITEEIKTLFKDAAEKKGLELVLSVCPQIPRVVRGDSLRLMQVLTNLLSNAIKFTPKGFVAMSIGHNVCHAEEKTPVHTVQSPKGLLFSVEDSGIGMDNEQIKKIFQPFSQADTSTTRMFGGTGLGLVISKKLVEAMGGELLFHSEPGKGSTFFFYLNLEEASSERGIADRPEALGEKMHFLVVDDQKPARTVLRKILESWNASVHEAGSGMEAIEAVMEADKKEKAFDCILMDWKMPGELDGLGAIKKLDALYKNKVLKGPKSPIFVISAYSREELPREKPLFKAFLSKPVTASDLFEAMVEALGSGNLPRITPKKDSKIPALSGYRILLVEDNALNQEVATRFIEKTGAGVILAENGLKAIEMTEREKPDLILMDLQMPIMDGFEATRKIRETERPDKQGLPIIALSAAVMENDRIKAREAGTSAHMAKPIDEAELYRTLARFLEPRGWINKEKPENDVNHFPELYGFNRKRAMAASLGDRAFYVKMLTSFARQLEEVFIPNTQKITRLNPEEIQHMAHALKGTAATVGAEQVSEIAETMDKTCKQGKLPPDTLIHSLEKALISAEYEIRNLLSSEQKGEKKAPLSVNEEEGRKALGLLLASLQQSELADDALLDTALDFIESMHGPETADEIRRFVEIFDMDQAAGRIQGLVLPQTKEF